MEIQKAKAADRTMDVASFKTIIEVQKKDLQKLRTEKAQDPDPKLGRQKVEWSSFMAQASKQSRKKKRKLNAAKNKKGREEKMEKERAIQEWLCLYNNRLNSDEDYEEFSVATIPYGAWGRVD